MKQLFTVLLIFPVTNLFAVSGPPDTMWTRRYGGSSYDCAYSVCQTKDSNFVFAGQVNGLASLVKVKPNGDMLWTRTYGDGYFYSMSQTQDSGFILTGKIKLSWEANENVYLIRTNQNGDTLWTQVYKSNSYNTASSICQTKDGEFIVVGTIFVSGKDNNVYILKANHNGDILWKKDYGGNGSDLAYSICPVPDADTSFMIVGETLDSLIKVYLLKITSTGDTLWTKSYNCPGNACKGYSICQTQDNNFIITGEASSSRIYLIKINNDGDTVFTKTYYISLSINTGYSICQTSDGKLVMTGGTRIGSYLDVYLIKIDLNGCALWTKNYGNYGNYEYGRSVCPTNDGGFIVAGQTIQTGLCYAYLSLFTQETGVEESNSPPLFSCNSFPNPVISQFSIEYNLPNISNTQLIIYDVSGICVKTFSNQNQSTGKHTLHWNGTNEAGKKMPAGIYFYTLTADNNTATNKFILMK